MSSAKSAPATKNDIGLLMTEMGRLYDANARWKEEIIRETKHHFDLRVEDIRYDLLGVNKDRIENHEDRLRRLERHTGVARS